MASVCIVFSPDGEPWFRYFDNYLRRVFPDIAVEPIEESCLLQLGNHTSKAATIMKQAKVHILVISPGYLQFYIENPKVTLKDLSKGVDVVVFLCATTRDDFAMEDACGHKMADRLPEFEDHCLLLYPQYDEMLEKVVEILESEYYSGKGKEESMICRTGDKPKANGKRKRRSKGFKFIPREVNCEGTTDVIISFDELYASEECEVQVDVEIESEFDGESSTKVTAVYLNPYSCSFRAPEHRAGVVKAYVYLQGKVLGTAELAYFSPAMDAISGIHQIYIQQINKLCSLLSKSQLTELDSSLAALLHHESMGLIPAAAFEYFHKVYRFQSSDVSEFELPTMFHLAARYGLHKLCQQYADFPDSRYAFCTYNVNHTLPEEMARSTNHLDIANLLENLRESDTSFQKLYDSYIIMKQGVMTPEYLNQMTADDSDVDYEDVPNESDMSAMAEQRFKSQGGQKSGSGAHSSQIDNRGEGDEPCSFVDKFLQPMENPYECRMQAQRLQAPVKLVEGTVSMQKNQQELIQIMQQVKNNQLTMTDAEVLFKEWKIRYQKKSASVKQKENQLAKIREETGKAQKEKKDGFPFSLGKKSGGAIATQCIPEIMPGTKHQTAKSPVDGLGDRTSTASSSGRESTCSIRSRTSATSGIDVDETIQEEVTSKFRPRNNFRNRSIHLQKLANELASPGALEPPPPPPPRPAGMTFTQPSIPLPKLERANSPSSRSSGKSADSLGKSHHLSADAKPPNNPSENRHLQVPNSRHQHGTVASGPKNITHQTSMPEFGNPPSETQPRKRSLPTSALQSSSNSGNQISVVIEEDEPGAQQASSRAAPKPRRKTEGLNDELSKVIQRKAENLQSGFNRDADRVSPALPKFVGHSKSDTSLNSLSASPKPFKKQPAVPPKVNK